MSEKICTKCGDIKPLTEYHKDKYQPDGLTTQCKPCRRLKALDWRNANLDRARENASKWYKGNSDYNATKARRWREENPEKHLELQKSNYEKFRDKRLAWRRQYVFGLEESEYQAMIEAHGNRCAICDAAPEKRALFIDHDHKTGVIRGLLCHGCNSGIGFFRDRVDVLERAIGYLLFYAEDEAA